MSWFWDLNCIRGFDRYLLLIFLAGTVLRVRRYRALLGMMWLFPGRWPHLLALVNQHRRIFLAWGTVLPALLAFLLSVGHMLACRLVWPQADITVAQLAEHWVAVLVIGALGAIMVCFDSSSAFRVGQWDRARMEKQFDQAEFWLHSWTAPMVRLFTLGFIHPRKRVGVEIRKALVAASLQLNTSLWWASLQVGLRIAFGAGLWLTYIWGWA